MKYLICFLLMLSGWQAGAQKVMTRVGTTSFFSDAKLEDIAAHSRHTTILINKSTGAVAVKLSIRSFEFEKALMQEHFNENYMESEKYPEATFSGKITDLSKVIWNKDGSYLVTVEGKLTIHGVVKNVKETATIDVKGTKVNVKCALQVKLADYGINNDKADNIAQTIDIKIEGVLEEMK